MKKYFAFREELEFYEQSEYSDSNSDLLGWLSDVDNSTWSNFADIKKQFATASWVGNQRVVFNIHGNKYRLIVAVAFSAQIVLVKFVGDAATGEPK